MTDAISAGTAAEARKFRVLVVDDDPAMGSYMALVLAKAGIHADTEQNSAAALERVVSDPPDLILLDVMMPGISGFEICERLKADPATALIPIVLITSLEDHKSRVRGIEAGGDDFITKPVKREEVVARVNTLCRLHETRKHLERDRLAAEVARKEEIRKAFSRYVSPRIADHIINDLGGKEALFNDAQRSSVVALFADLRGFTRLTEQTEVVRVVEMLNEYFAVLTEAVYQHEGTIFNMAGDSLFVGFNVPLAQPDAAERAYRCALDMRASLVSVLARWHAGGAANVGMGIGICMGEAVIGNIGSPHYMNYTVIGDPVNTAARLMQSAKSNEILICSGFYEQIRKVVPGEMVEPRGEVTLRGRMDSVTVYAITAPLPAT